MSEEKATTGANEMEDQFGGIFDVTADEISNDGGFEESQRDPDFYRPSLKHDKVKDGQYESRIRLVPNPNDRNLQKVHKFIYLLPDPDNPERSFYVDCLSNNPKDPRAKNNIITQAYFMLKDHDAKVMRGIAKQYFQRKQFWWMLAQIMDDPQEPELTGEVKIFRFGNQINEKLVLEGKDNSRAGKKATVVTDPFLGKDLYLFVNEKEVEGRDGKMRTITNYDKSYFINETNSMCIDFETAKPEEGFYERLDRNEDNMRSIFQYLKEKAPDLSKVAYQPWDDAFEAKVIESVRATIDDPAIFDKLWAKVYKGKKYSAPAPKEEKSEEKAEEHSEEMPQVDGGAPEVDAKAEEATEDLKSKVAAESTEEAKAEEKTEEKSEVESETTDAGGGSSEDEGGDFDNVDEFNFDEIDG